MSFSSISLGFPAAEDCPQSGDAAYIKLFLPNGDCHVFWASTGTAVQPTLTGSPTYHEVDITDMEDVAVRDAFCQAVVDTGFWSVAGFEQNFPPENTVAPTLDKTTAVVGATITITHGTYTYSPTSYSYRWFEDGEEIDGETGQTYIVENPDVTITAEETAHNYLGASDPVETSNECETEEAGTNVVEEDWEGGDSATCPFGWTGNTGPTAWNFRYTANPIAGEASLEAINSAISLKKDFAALADGWFFLAWNPRGGVFLQPIALTDGGESAYIAFGRWGDTALRITGDGHDEFPSFATTNTTTIYFWAHRIKGTGANGVFQLYASLTPTRPGSPLVSWTNGTSTFDFSRIYLSDGGGNAVGGFDWIRVSPNEILSDPE